MMPFRGTDDILIHSDEGRAYEFLERVWGCDPVFTCAIGNTETAKIPGLSAAGAVPQITDFTPAADMELLLYGETRCMDGVPVTPEGIPTPALITRSALTLSDMPLFVVDAGTRVKPHTPFFDVGGRPGEDIREGSAVGGAAEAYERARVLGHQLAKGTDLLVVSESIAGGTTTALAVLIAMGASTGNEVSSSLPENPRDQKTAVVMDALQAAGIDPGSMGDDPLGAVSAVGDPMMPVNAGLVSGAAAVCPVLLAGGTQMANVLAIVSRLDPSALDNLAMGTTRWIMRDGSSDMTGLVARSGDVPLLSTGLDFSDSRHHGLRVYEQGFVKEGVGCGGSAIAATLKSCGNVGNGALLAEVERNYEKLLSSVA